MTYTYSNRQVSNYALKRVEGSCHKDPNHTRMVGIMCKSCPFYEGMASKFVMRKLGYRTPEEADKYVVCNGFEKDDEGPNVSEIRESIYERIEYAALCALDG